jgi:hypothetical protein
MKLLSRSKLPTGPSSQSPVESALECVTVLDEGGKEGQARIDVVASQEAASTNLDDDDVDGSDGKGAGGVASLSPSPTRSSAMQAIKKAVRVGRSAAGNHPSIGHVAGSVVDLS